MQKFNLSKREKQLDYLEKQADFESIYNSNKGYLIKVNNKVVSSCQCAETAIMLLNTEFKNINVWIIRGYTVNQLNSEV